MRRQEAILGCAGTDWGCRVKPQSLFSKMGTGKKGEGLGGKLETEGEKSVEGA